MKIPSRVRYINKKFLNRLMMKIAGKKNSPIALIRHAGRKSGKIYQTPIMLAPDRDGFVFALTYGTGVDWYRNILASGHADLVYNEKEYQLFDPAILDSLSGQAAFRPPKSTILKIIGIMEFFSMKKRG